MTEPTRNPDTDRAAQEPVPLFRGDTHPEGRGFLRFFGRMAGLVTTGLIMFVVAIIVIVIMVLVYGPG